MWACPWRRRSAAWANCWKRNWHPNRPARVGYGWGWFPGQWASQVPVPTALSEWGLGSISEELTQEAARAYVLAQVNQAVEEALAQPRPFVTIERDGEGEPVAVQADTAALNELRLQVLGTLEDSL